MLWVVAVLAGLVSLGSSAPMNISAPALTPDTFVKQVGLSVFEAGLMSASKLGKFDLTFSPQDARDMVAAVNPFTHFEEFKENIVLIDEFPYVPVVEVPQFNSTFVLSNLAMHQNVNTELISVEFHPGWQSVKFVEIPMNVTFDWKINGSDASGNAFVTVPHAWVHQNIEFDCVKESPSLLVYEGRTDFFPQHYDFSTTFDNEPLMAAFAEQLHMSRAFKSYVGNALQHQLASRVGQIHWRMQDHMRELCLVCERIKTSNASVSIRLKGEKTCLNTVPPFTWRGMPQDMTPRDLQAIASEALQRGLATTFKESKSSDELVSGQALNSQPKPIDQLRPKKDPREKMHKKHPGAEVGFVEEASPLPAWRKQIGQMWLKWHGRAQDGSPLNKNASL